MFPMPLNKLNQAYTSNPAFMYANHCGVLWHINQCRLFKVNSSLYIYMIYI